MLSAFVATGRRKLNSMVALRCFTLNLQRNPSAVPNAAATMWYDVATKTDGFAVRPLAAS